MQGLIWLYAMTDKYGGQNIMPAVMPGGFQSIQPTRDTHSPEPVYFTLLESNLFSF